MNSLSRIAAWSEFLHEVRVCLRSRGFLEVTTPHLVPVGAFEGVIDTVRTRSSRGTGELHTSPEMEMKKLMVDCPVDMYQICQCFRDDPHSPVHRTEFTMLEFYRMDASLQAILQDMEALLRHLGYGGEIRKKSMRELFRDQMGWDFADTPETEDFRSRLRQDKSVHVADDDQWWDMFARILIEKIEPALDVGIPTIVYNYPRQMAALSAPAPDPACCDRFEIYWKGMELCNGCVELTRADDLERRVDIEANVRRARGKAPHPRPEGLLDAMKRGLPDSSGVAVGLNRLFQCLNPQYSAFGEEPFREH